MKEEWKDIQGFEGLYKISNSGKVKSNKRNVPHKRHGNLFVRERILSATPDSSGYLQVAICKNCKRYCFKIHLLVWDHFGNELRQGKEVDHIKGKLNNWIWNLQLLTGEQNIQKYYSTFIKKDDLPIGVRKRNSKYEARAWFNHQHNYLGVFDTPELAKAAWLQAKQNYKGDIEYLEDILGIKDNE